MRYFLALQISELARSLLRQMQPAGDQKFRLVPPDQFHLTLHFMGDINSDLLPRIAEQIAELAAITPVIHAANAGGGLFLGKSGQSVLHLKLDQCSTLRELHAASSRVLEQTMAFQAEDRPFQPHITLARISERLSKAQQDVLLAGIDQVSMESLQFNHISLFSSDFSGGPPRYDEIFTYSLHGAEIEFGPCDGFDLNSSE